MLIIPPHIHITLSPLLSTNAGPTVTFVVFGIHGETIIGVHGMGVRVPNAEAVADATAGFVRDEHIPNDLTFNIGIKSIIVPIGDPAPKTLLVGKIFKEEGAEPNGHLHIPPLIHFVMPIIFLP